MSFLADDRILVLGHRGESFRATENTIKSYECALKDGADGVELDVHITKDGKLAAHFEHTIAITPDGPKIMTLCD